MLPAFLGDEHRAYQHEGGTPAALLVHGFPGTPAEMRPLAAVLSDVGWTVQVPLLPGFGAEIDTLANPARGVRVPGAAEWLAAVQIALDALAQNHRPLLLIGNSMGGALSLAAAGIARANGQHVAPHGLVLLNPFWRLNNVLWQALPLIARVVPRFHPFNLVRMNFDDPETRKGILTFMPGADLDDPQVQAAIRSFAIPTRVLDEVRRAGALGYRWAAQATTPALVIAGSGDTLVPPANTRKLAARLPGSVELVEIPGEHNLINPAASGWAQIRSSLLAFAEMLAQQPVSSPT